MKKSMGHQKEKASARDEEGMRRRRQGKASGSVIKKSVKNPLVTCKVTCVPRFLIPNFCDDY